MAVLRQGTTSGLAFGSSLTRPARLSVITSARSSHIPRQHAWVGLGGTRKWALSPRPQSRLNHPVQALGGWEPMLDMLSPEEIAATADMLATAAGTLLGPEGPVATTMAGAATSVADALSAVVPPEAAAMMDSLPRTEDWTASRPDASGAGGGSSSGSTLGEPGADPSAAESTSQPPNRFSFFKQPSGIDEQWIALSPPLKDAAAPVPATPPPRVNELPSVAVTLPEHSKVKASVAAEAEVGVGVDAHSAAARRTVLAVAEVGSQSGTPSSIRVLAMSSAGVGGGGGGGGGPAPRETITIITEKVLLPPAAGSDSGIASPSPSSPPAVIVEQSGELTDAFDILLGESAAIYDDDSPMYSYSVPVFPETESIDVIDSPPPTPAPPPSSTALLYSVAEGVSSSAGIAQLPADAPADSPPLLLPALPATEEEVAAIAAAAAALLEAVSRPAATAALLADADGAQAAVEVAQTVVAEAAPVVADSPTDVREVAVTESEPPSPTSNDGRAGTADEQLSPETMPEGDGQVPEATTGVPAGLAASQVVAELAPDLLSTPVSRAAVAVPQGVVEKLGEVADAAAPSPSRPSPPSPPAHPAELVARVFDQRLAELTAAAAQEPPAPAFAASNCPPAPESPAAALTEPAQSEVQASHAGAAAEHATVNVLANLAEVEPGVGPVSVPATSAPDVVGVADPLLAMEPEAVPADVLPAASHPAPTIEPDAASAHADATTIELQPSPSPPRSATEGTDGYVPADTAADAAAQPVADPSSPLAPLPESEPPADVAKATSRADVAQPSVTIDLTVVSPEEAGGLDTPPSPAPSPGPTSQPSSPPLQPATTTASVQADAPVALSSTPQAAAGPPAGTGAGVLSDIQHADTMPVDIAVEGSTSPQPPQPPQPSQAPGKPTVVSDATGFLLGVADTPIVFELEQADVGFSPPASPPTDAPGAAPSLLANPTPAAPAPAATAATTAAAGSAAPASATAATTAQQLGATATAAAGVAGVAAVAAVAADTATTTLTTTVSSAAAQPLNALLDLLPGLGMDAGSDAESLSGAATASGVQLDLPPVPALEAPPEAALPPGVIPPMALPTGAYLPEQLIPGEDTTRYDFPDGAAWELVASRPLAGGTLEIVRWYKRRMIRVWLPPGYDLASAEMMGGLPSVLLHDAQNVFDPMLSASGTTWQAAETASQLITSGVLPPFVIVAVDHPGAARPYEYTPYRPGIGPGGFRADAESWPGGGVDAYLEFLVRQVLPQMSKRYGLSERPEERVLGGSSFGGIATLCAALKYPDVWGNVLVESPSLWIAEEKFLFQDIARHRGPLPQRMYVGMGGREFSGVRDPEVAELFPEADDLVASYANKLAGFMEDQGLVEGEGLMVEVQLDTTHNEAAWAGRLPGALVHLCSHWWSRVLQQHPDHLHLTQPPRLRPGYPAVFLFNRARSPVLASKHNLRLTAGFNFNWEHKLPDIELRPVPWADRVPAAMRRNYGAEAANSHKNGNGHDNGHSNGNGNGKAGAEVAEEDVETDWLLGTLIVPSDAYEMHFVLNGTPDSAGRGARVWDNNAGSNYHMPLYPLPPRPRPVPQRLPSTTVVSDKKGGKGAATVPEAGGAAEVVPPVSLAVMKAQEALSQNVQPIAWKNAARLYFTVPETLLAGAPAMVYFNRRKSGPFYNEPNIKLHYGWNGWDKKLMSTGAATQDFKPTTLWADGNTDWWATSITVPEGANELNFAFTNGAANNPVWDSNGGFNYTAAVTNAAPEGEIVARPRKVESVQSLPHGAGTMHIVFLQKREKDDPGYSKQSRWTDEKIIRVWTPPGWSPDNTPPGGWPVLYLSDGQNLFEDALAHQGVAWNVGYQASDLITRGELPGVIVVGIDSAGPLRSLNYLPYAPGTGQGGFRGDAERWPGGGVSVYMRRVTEEIMPLVQQRFHATTDPAKSAFGGGSFGGVCALWAAMHYPQLFGGVLAESPSLWIAEGRFLGDMAAYKGQLPSRIFLGCGTREYSATRDHERLDVDALLLHYCQEAARILDDKGARPGQGRLKFQVEPGAGHHEGAWKWRFSGALTYLFHHLWDLQPRPVADRPNGKDE